MTNLRSFIDASKYGINELRAPCLPGGSEAENEKKESAGFECEGDEE